MSTLELPAYTSDLSLARSVEYLSSAALQGLRIWGFRVLGFGFRVSVNGASKVRSWRAYTENPSRKWKDIRGYENVESDNLAALCGTSAMHGDGGLCPRFVVGEGVSFDNISWVVKWWSVVTSNWDCLMSFTHQTNSLEDLWQFKLNNLITP